MTATTTDGREARTPSPHCDGCRAGSCRVHGAMDPRPPLLAVDAHGYVWRVYRDGWSMAPQNPDNNPVPQPVTYYYALAPTEQVVPQGQGDQIRSLLDMARIRAESAPLNVGLDPAAWPHIHRHYTDADTCSHGEELPLSWLELGFEAENAQQLLDFAGIPDGLPQGHGDVDWRVAALVLAHHRATAVLANIASAHQQGTGPVGMVDGFCVECTWAWPCPTYLWASGERDPLSPWNPADDDATATGGDER